MPRRRWSDVTYEPVSGDIEEVDIWTRPPGNGELVVRPTHQTPTAPVPPAGTPQPPVWPPFVLSPAVQWQGAQTQTPAAVAPVINNIPVSPPIFVHDSADARSRSGAIASIEFNGQPSNPFSPNGPYPDPYYGRWRHIPHHPPLESEEAIVRAHVLTEENDKKNASEQAVQKYKLRLAEAEKEKETIIHEHELEMKKKEEDIKRLKDTWEAEQKAERLKKENEKKKQEEDLKSEMRKKMVASGFEPDEIEQAISGKPYHPPHYPHPHPHPSPHSHPHPPCGDLSCPSLDWSDSGYVRIRREQLNTETLDYFGIPWRFDPDDREIIVILRPKHTFDIQDLFSHTRKHYDFDVHMRAWKRKAVIEVRPKKKKSHLYLVRGSNWL